MWLAEAISPKGQAHRDNDHEGQHRYHDGRKAQRQGLVELVCGLSCLRVSKLDQHHYNCQAKYAVYSRSHGCHHDVGPYEVRYFESLK